MGWTIGIQIPAGAAMSFLFIFATASRPAVGPTQPPSEWVKGAFCPGVKQAGRDADHSPPSSPEVRNARSYTSTSQYVFMAFKYRDNFIFTFEHFSTFCTLKDLESKI
jgi:hypothetical protein